MSELVPRAGGAVSRPVGSGISTRSVSDAAWDGTVVEFDERSIPERDGLIAQMMRALPGVVRSRDGYRRRRSGWRAYADRIELYELSQPLAPRADGRFAPDGGWQVELVVRDATQKPTLRKGDVAHDTRARDGAARDIAATDDVEEALAQLAYLPAVVRDGVVTSIPVAAVFDAETIRFTRADGSVYFRTVALRMAGSRALVLVASYQDGATTWQVEQRTYTLDTSERELTR